MKNILFFLSLMVSTMCSAQIYLGPGYKNMEAEVYKLADPCLIQVLYNDTFMISTRTIDNDCSSSLPKIIWNDQEEVLLLKDSIYVCFDKQLALITIYVISNNTLVRIQSRKEFRYSNQLPEKMLFILTEIRRNSYSTLFASN